MGVYIKHLQAEKVKILFMMLGLHIEDGDIIEVTKPHGRLIDADREIKTITEIIESNSLTEIAWNEYDFCRRTLKTVPTVIEAEGES